MSKNENQILNNTYASDKLPHKNNVFGHETPESGIYEELIRIEPTPTPKGKNWKMTTDKGGRRVSIYISDEIYV